VIGNPSPVLHEQASPCSSRSTCYSQASHLKQKQKILLSIVGGNSHKTNKKIKWQLVLLNKIGEIRRMVEAEGYKLKGICPSGMHRKYMQTK